MTEKLHGINTRNKMWSPSCDVAQ